MERQVSNGIHVNLIFRIIEKMYTISVELESLVGWNTDYLEGR
jgi:hypothetical protein